MSQRRGGEARMKKANIVQASDDSGELQAILQVGEVITRIIMDQQGENMQLQATAQVEMIKAQQPIVAEQEQTKRHAETAKHETIRSVFIPLATVVGIVAVGIGLLLWHGTIKPEHVALIGTHAVTGALGWFGSSARKKAKDTE